MGQRKKTKMGVACESSSTTLLCPEDNNSVLGFDDEECVTELAWIGDHQTGGSCENFFIDFPLQSDECLATLILKESHHMPKDDYAIRLQSGDVDLSVRNEAIDWIWKVHAHYRFKPLTAYLSVNYLDRFLSYYELPQGKAWMTQLLSVACLSLASKVEETEVPLSLDLQVVEPKYVFEARTIKRMELLVLSTLKWRMLAVTPFSFIDYFIKKLDGDESPPTAFSSKSVELILKTIRKVEFLEFNPSEIAAAVALFLSMETPITDGERVLSSCLHINKDRVLKCNELIRNMKLMSSESVSSIPQSPIGVLDAAYMSYESSVTTPASSHHISPNSKRRKINRLPCS